MLASIFVFTFCLLQPRCEEYKDDIFLVFFVLWKRLKCD